MAVSGAAIDFGATRVLSEVTFTVTRGEKWGIIGRNGSGKTSLFRLLIGELEPATGSVSRSGALRFSLLEQHRTFAGATTV
ncbi:MAG: ATP-binding cassette domain-containing protein, partial [Gemmatimonadetes bacterium]|nr:ATP-binding cassette domain-containing protein [Gemmatimonadota bacterium]